MVGKYFWAFLLLHIVSPLYGCDRVGLAKTEKLFLGRPHSGFVPKPSNRKAVLSQNSDGISTGWFTQKLDHFDPSVTTTWSQLYQQNDNFFKPGGPMFVMISGETTADISWMTYGQWYKNAQIFGALMFQLEHRFYGSSHPTEDASTANLKYLTSEQALADLDYFINAMANAKGIKKIIVFGGSYAGNLAAWYQAKYSTAIGAVSSSGPVTAEADFTQYLETVGTVMDYFSPGCSALVQQAFSVISTLAANESEAAINGLFEPCPPSLNFKDPYDVATFFNSLITPWMYAVQYTAPDAADSAVFRMCDIISNPEYGKTVIERLSYFYYHFDCCTYHNYDAQIALLKQTGWSDYWVKTGTRQWTWQTCNEFGYYQSTDSSSQPFGQTVPLSYIEDTSCTKIFGQSFAQIGSNVNATNVDYGGVNGRVNGHEKRTFFVNGSLDPWHNLAVYQTSPDPSDVLGYINGTSHCYDMGDDLPTDPVQLTSVRNEITQQIALWLSS